MQYQREKSIWRKNREAARQRKIENVIILITLPSLVVLYHVLAG